MGTFHILGDIHKDVLVSGVSLLQSGVARCCADVGNSGVQSILDLDR